MAAVQFVVWFSSSCWLDQRFLFSPSLTWHSFIPRSEGKLLIPALHLVLHLINTPLFTLFNPSSKIRAASCLLFSKLSRLSTISTPCLHHFLLIPPIHHHHTFTLPPSPASLTPLPQLARRRIEEEQPEFDVSSLWVREKPDSVQILRCFEVFSPLSSQIKQLITLFIFHKTIPNLQDFFKYQEVSRISFKIVI